MQYNRHMNIYYVMADEQTKEYMIATAYMLYYRLKCKWNDNNTTYNITTEEYGKIWQVFDEVLQEQYGVNIEQAGIIAQKYYGLPFYRKH